MYALATLCTIDCASILGSGDIVRKVKGDWIEKFYNAGRQRRSGQDGAKGQSSKKIIFHSLFLENSKNFLKFTNIYNKFGEFSKNFESRA